MKERNFFYFETLKPISKFKFDLGKSFGGNDQNALFLLCFGQLLCHHSLTHAAFCLYNYKDTITRCQGFNNKITNKLTPKNHKNFTLKKNK